MNNNTLCSPHESEIVSAKKKRVIIKELVKGHEAAKQLKIMLENPFRNEGSFSSRELISHVLTSFTEALAIINSSSADEVSAHRNLLINSGENGSTVAASRNAQPSGDCSEKKSQKGGRGRYFRRKNALTWTILSCTTDDNHAWRKYGQKAILNSEFPRSYFRCIHKYDQGCRAIKQVQVDHDNPNMYQTTYIGLHTCNATPMATHSPMGSSSTAWEPYLLNFDRDSNNVPNTQDHHHHHHNISSPSLTIKQEFLKKDTLSDVTDQNLDPSLWSDLMDFQPFKPTINVPLRMESDNNADNVYSCADSQCLDMDFEVPSVQYFGSDFHFDQIQLL